MGLSLTGTWPHTLNLSAVVLANVSYAAAVLLDFLLIIGGGVELSYLSFLRVCFAIILNKCQICYMPLYMYSHVY